MTGTATDTGGGVVAGVEVSVDGGTTWHPATGTTSWTYTFYPSGHRRRSGHGAGHGRQRQHQRHPGDPVVRPLTGAQLAVRQPGVPGRGDHRRRRRRGRRAVHPADATASSPASGSTRESGNTGTHTGTLWTATGTRIATGTFSGESPTGWQTLTFARRSPSPRDDLRRVLLRAERPLRGRPVGDFSYRDLVAGPLAAPRSPGQRQRRLHLRRRRSRTTRSTTPTIYVDVNFTPTADARADGHVGHAAGRDATGVAITCSHGDVLQGAQPGHRHVHPEEPERRRGRGRYDDLRRGTTRRSRSRRRRRSARRRPTRPPSRPPDTNGNPVTCSWSASPPTRIRPCLKLFATDAVPAHGGGERLRRGRARA